MRKTKLDKALNMVIRIQTVQMPPVPKKTLTKEEAVDFQLRRDAWVDKFVTEVKKLLLEFISDELSGQVDRYDS